MTQKTITIAGKQVGIAYCFGTELAFHDLADHSLENADLTDDRQAEKLIMAAIIAYYQSLEPEQEPPVNVKDLRFHSKPKELVEALTTILSMRAEWYESPKGEATDEEPKDESKRKYRKPKNA